MSDNTPDLTGIRMSQSQSHIRNADYRLLDRTKLSPMYRHYVEVKEQYPHALLLYQLRSPANSN
jgi:DNA mismatch repair protein MutS